MTRWHIGSCILDAELFQLSRSGERVPAQRRVLQFLLCLAENTERVVPKEDVVRQVWAGVAVSDATVRNTVKLARRLLGDDAQLLRTVPGYGYRLVLGDAAGETIRPETEACSPNERLVKLSEPPLGSSMDRDRLFDLLDAARVKPVVWVMGPPGSGKTTVVRTYVESRGLPRTWYRVDEGDRDIASVSSYLDQALLTTGQRPGPLPVHAPASSGNPSLIRRRFERAFAQLPNPCLLIFDNYEEAPPDAGIHEVIRKIAVSLPEGVRLVVISRGQPPASLARARLHDNLAIIDWQQLRFSRSEALALAAARARGLDESTVAELHEISRGWAAGFALLSGQARTLKHLSVPALVERTMPAISDYFASEVLRHMSPDEQLVLLKTSVLPKLTRRLAQPLAGEQAARVLETLERNNAFVESRVPGCFEYHPLFRQFLVQRAESILGRKLMSELQQRVDKRSNVSTTNS